MSWLNFPGIWRKNLLKQGSFGLCLLAAAPSQSHVNSGIRPKQTNAQVMIHNRQSPRKNRLEQNLTVSCGLLRMSPFGLWRRSRKRSWVFCRIGSRWFWPTRFLCQGRRQQTGHQDHRYYRRQSFEQFHCFSFLLDPSGRVRPARLRALRGGYFLAEESEFVAGVKESSRFHVDNAQSENQI